MPFTDELRQFQANAGTAHPAPKDGSALIGERDFVEHARDAFRSGYGERHSDEAVTRMAQSVIQGWQAQGREFELTLDWAERLAAEVGNTLSGAGGGVQMFAGSAPRETEALAAGSLSDALNAHQREKGLTR